MARQPSVGQIAEMSSGRKKAMRRSAGSLTLPSHVCAVLSGFRFQRVRCIEFVIRRRVSRYISGICSSTLGRRLAFPVKRDRRFLRRPLDLTYSLIRANSRERVYFSGRTFSRRGAVLLEIVGSHPNLGQRVVTVYSVLQVLQRSILDDFSSFVNVCGIRQYLSFF